MRILQYVFIICSLLAGSLLGFGEQPKDGSIPLKPIYPAGLTALTDKQTQTTTPYTLVILDLGQDQYLAKLELWQNETPINIQTSSDGIGYDQVATPSPILERPLTYDLTGFNGRYIKIINPTTVNCTEIKAYAAPDFQLTYVSINAIADVYSCAITVQTTGKGYMQLLYGMNYDFIYNKILLGIYSAMSLTDSETVVLTGLAPETTYRYQFKFRDINGKTIESNYFTFTTLPAVK